MPKEQLMMLFAQPYLNSLIKNKIKSIHKKYNLKIKNLNKNKKKNLHIIIDQMFDIFQCYFKKNLEDKMKCVIVSDTHLGDPKCALVNEDYTINHHFYDQFKQYAGTGNDYLIMLGDIIDCAVSNYDHSFKVAKTFFRQVEKDGIANEIVITTGNHDIDLWHTAQMQENTIKPINNGQNPNPFPWAIPGVIDDRNGKGRLVCTPDYNNLFLNNLTPGSLKFHVVTPNIYIVRKNGESVLLTHGQYFDTAWSLCGEWALKIFGDDLTKGNPLNLIAQMVGNNHPLNQLECSGIGQAEPFFTHIVQQLQQQSKEHRDELLLKYLTNLAMAITQLPEKDRKWIMMLVYIIYSLLSKKSALELTELNDAFTAVFKDQPLDIMQSFVQNNIESESEEDRMTTYFNACKNEIATSLNSSIPIPNRVLYGHTHTPVSWETPRTYINMPFANTGGWLTKLNKGATKESFCGGGVFIYDTQNDFSSKIVES